VPYVRARGPGRPRADQLGPPNGSEMFDKRVAEFADSVICGRGDAHINLDSTAQIMSAREREEEVQELSASGWHSEQLSPKARYTRRWIAFAFGTARDDPFVGRVFAADTSRVAEFVMRLHTEAHQFIVAR
jgi:hypothetical protein